MRTKRTFRYFATVLALATLIAGAAETTEGADAAIPRMEEGAGTDVPEPSAVLIGAIGLLLLLGRRR